MDESSKQLLKETRQSLLMEPDKAEREDYEYERGGERIPIYGSPLLLVESHRR